MDREAMFAQCSPEALKMVEDKGLWLIFSLSLPVFLTRGESLGVT